MHRHRFRSDDEAPSDRYRLDPPAAYSLALALAMPLMAGLLLSPAGPALLLGLAAVALAAVGL
ncbi:MAG: hypothetical protein ABEJ71_02610 [Halodesulfurarchaeum sp.]